MLFLYFSVIYLFKQMLQEIILILRDVNFQSISWLMVKSKEKFTFEFFAYQWEHKDASTLLVRAELISAVYVQPLTACAAAPSDTGSRLGLPISTVRFTLCGWDKLSCEYFFPALSAKVQAHADKSCPCRSILGLRLNLDLSAFAC